MNPTPQPPLMPPGAPPAGDLLRLDVQLCFAMHSASRAFDRVYRRLLHGMNLTYPQYLVMMVLWERGDVPVKRLGELLRLDSGTLSPLLKRLDAAGLVRRERSPQDERSVIVRLTDEGVALRDRAEQIPGQIAAASGLGGPEAVELLARIGHLTNALDAAFTEPEG